MGVDMTGIPMLRNKAYETAGPDRFRTFIRYLESMATLLTGMRQWTEGCSCSDGMELANIAQRLHEDSEFAFAGVVEGPQGREEIVQATLLRLLRARRRESREKAAKELEVICRWNLQSFYSFFKKYGRNVTQLTLKQEKKVLE